MLVLAVGIVLIPSCRGTSTAQPLARNGEMDLRQWDFVRLGNVSLDGEWEFHWKRLLASNPPPPVRNFNPGAIADVAPPTPIIAVPGLWNGFRADERSEPLSGIGYASYRLRLRLPPGVDTLGVKMADQGTAASLFINGRRVIQSGTVGDSEERSRPYYLPGKATVTNLRPENEVILEVSNFSHYKGGAWENIRIGPAEKIDAEWNERQLFDMFVTGSILIMGAYHVGLYSLRRRDFSSLYFALFCFAIAVRILVTGQRFLIATYPTVSFEIWNKLEYGSIYVAGPVFAFFLQNLFPRLVHRFIPLLYTGIQAVLLLFVLATPIGIYGRTFVVFAGLTVLLSAYSVVALAVGIYQKEGGAAAALAGFLCLFGTVLNDIIKTMYETSDLVYMAPYGLFIFIFSQAYILSLRFSNAFKGIEHLSEDLQRTNLAYSRFVPVEFLNLLGKSSVVDVHLGDQTHKDMTILFSDIRSFTEMSAKMSPKENFEFINSYLQVMGPIIRSHNGFIDKYLGDGILGLFPGNPEDALLCALGMLEELRHLNTFRVDSGHEPIGIGIGIHSGPLMLGTVGENERMDGTVISDAVNLASRIEGMTRLFHSNVLISGTSFARIPNQDRFAHRTLTNLRVKGVKMPVTVVEVLTGYEPEQLEKFLSTREDFEKAFASFQARAFDSAAEQMEEIVRRNPHDRAALRLARRSRFFLRHGFMQMKAVKDEKGSPGGVAEPTPG